MNTTALLAISALFVVFVLLDLLAIRKYRKFVRMLTFNAKRDAIADLSKDWTVLGRKDNKIDKAFLTTMQECFELMVKKNNDYGTDNLAQYGLAGLAVRMTDKLSRLVTLSADGAKIRVQTESLEDTAKDLINYSLVTVAMLRGAWPKYKANEKK